jgi:DNA-binding transcriptional LysR family regulator
MAINKTEFVSFLGPSGLGKTTLFPIIAAEQRSCLFGIPSGPKGGQSQSLWHWRVLSLAHRKRDRDAQSPPAKDTALGDWLGRIGLGLDDIGPRIGFQNPALLVDAAPHGVGVGLVRHALVVDHLTQKDLVRLFRHSAPGSETIYLPFAPGLQWEI